MSRLISSLCVVMGAFFSITSATKSQSSPYTSEFVAPPNVTGIGGWNDALAKAKALLAKMSLEDKATMLTGVSGGPCTGNTSPIDDLDFPGLCLSDGPAGITIANFASVFPPGLSVAASWDKDLARVRGLYMGQEYREKGINVMLGPVVGPLGRNPLDGRIWEGYGPDPFLSGVMGALTVEGVQTSGTQACIKHFILNEQETQRTKTTVDNVTVAAVSSNIDDRTLREAYLWPFADAVKAGVASVMCSYNRINGTYACENSKVQNGILKGELGFQGYVMSDWGADMSSSPSVMGGLDMDMPGPLSGPGATQSSVLESPSYYGGTLVELVNNGIVPLWRIDDMVLRILTPWYHLGQDRPDYPTLDPGNGVLFAGFGSFTTTNSNTSWRTGPPTNRDVRGNHADLIRELAVGSATLLKNVNGTLPMKTPPKYLGVFGGDSASQLSGPTTSVDEFGVFTGSNAGRATYLITPLEAIKNWAYPHGTLIQWNFNTSSVIESVSLNPQIAIDACIVFINAQSGEGSDRTSLDFDYDGAALVVAVAAVCNNTIVVTHSVGPNLYSFADNENVTAIIAAHLPSTEAGTSIVDILSGRVNPSGKLPYTIPYKESDSTLAAIANFTGSSDPNAWQSNFTEGLFIDYRHFDQYNITPRYEFGFGLSYTTFEISDLSVESSTKCGITPFPATDESAPGGNPELYKTIAAATFAVTNTGQVEGATVAQLYLGFPSTSAPSGTPPQVLRGFSKVLLQPDETKHVTISLNRKSMSYWDVVSQDWRVSAGAFEVRVGLSSRDIRSKTSVVLLK